MQSFQGDFKISKPFRVNCTWFLLPSTAVWLMYQVTFRWNSLTRSMMHIWQSTSVQSQCWIFALPQRGEISTPDQACSEDRSSLWNYPSFGTGILDSEVQKSRHRYSMNDNHISPVLCIATSDIHPDFNVLVQAQNRLDNSHWRGKNRWEALQVIVCCITEFL